MPSRLDEAATYAELAAIEYDLLAIEPALDLLTRVDELLKDTESNAALETRVRAGRIAQWIAHYRDEAYTARVIAHQRFEQALAMRPRNPRLVMDSAIGLLEADQTIAGRSGPAALTRIAGRYQQLARELSEDAASADLALTAYYQVAAVGLELVDHQLARSALKEAQTTLQFGASDSHRYGSLRYWESRVALATGDTDGADEPLHDFFATKLMSPRQELQQGLAFAAFLRVSGDEDGERADVLLTELLPRASEAGLRRIVRQAEEDRRRFPVEAVLRFPYLGIADL